MPDWKFLTNHAQALLFIASEPNSRLRDIAGALDVTERTAYGIVADLSQGGYVAKEKEGRRNVYHVQSHMPIRDAVGQHRAIGELLGLFLDSSGSRDHT
ncbi:MAG TPA: AsnC family transcriptional regulator [Acidimicrobiia bacterium]|nr:AsnC family transcriptional regulator [Acidimicrobiia bacterium]